MNDKIISELKQIDTNADGKPYMCDIERINKHLDRSKLLELIQELLSKSAVPKYLIDPAKWRFLKSA